MIRLGDSNLGFKGVSTAISMMMFAADDEVMLRSGGLNVWVEIRGKER